MHQEWNIIGDYSVEVWFRIEKDDDGYPQSKTWEQLLAKPLREAEDCFQLESIPFFLRHVSRGDVVRAKITENSELGKREVFEFDGVVDRGGHNTYRLLLRMKRLDDPEFTTNELLSKALFVEEEYGDFFAVDVPPSVDQQAIDNYLITEARSGRWELQDGYLHNIRR